MRCALLIAIVCAAACGDETAPPEERAIDLVDPLTGTGGLGWTVGSIPPGPMLPFGMARPGPDTSTNGGAPNFSHCAGYWYADKEVRGFSQLHVSGTGVPDYGVLMIMPALELDETRPVSERNYSQTLDHDRETAAIGRYTLTLIPSRIKVEVGATLRTALYRITYPEGQVENLILDVDHGLNGTTETATLSVDAAHNEISGSFRHKGELVGPSSFELHFLLRADRAFQRSDASARQVVVGFDPAQGKIVNVQIGVSFIDVATARGNLDAEFTNYDLDAAEAAAREAWTRALDVVHLRGGTETNRRRFYSALYDLQQMPTLFTEAGNKYRGLDQQTHTADGFTYYSDFSLWDTFRTFHPLITLLRPDIQKDFSRSLMRMTEETGRIPKWPLATVETDTEIGYHGETVMTDAFLKGVDSVDGESLWARFSAAAFPGQASARKRDCLDAYLMHGYCPADQEGRSASVTTENAFADFVLSRLAKKLGHDAEASALEMRAKSWQPLLNDRGFIQGKNSDGTFTADFADDFFSDDYVEGNARQWTLFVPHDVAGLAEKLGGTEAFIDRLNTFFEDTAAAEKTVLPDLWYWHGNEPDIHAAYMFVELGRPDLTARWVEWILQNRYREGPDGLDGNDDGGTLSSWYVWSSLGLYPKIGENRYLLGKPRFEEATIALPGGALTIRAVGLSETAVYVKSATFNGSRLTEPFLAHDALKDGGELIFEMSDSPVFDAY